MDMDVDDRRRLPASSPRRQAVGRVGAAATSGCRHLLPVLTGRGYAVLDAAHRPLVACLGALLLLALALQRRKLGEHRVGVELGVLVLRLRRSGCSRSVSAAGSSVSPAGAGCSRPREARLHLEVEVDLRAQAQRHRIHRHQVRRRSSACARGSARSSTWWCRRGARSARPSVRDGCAPATGSRSAGPGASTAACSAAPCASIPARAPWGPTASGDGSGRPRPWRSPRASAGRS